MATMVGASAGQTKHGQAKRRQANRGQALVLATLSLFMLFGIMGLAVDLGWSYYRKQVAQTAADAAALAAAVQAENSSGTNTIVCGTNNVVCQATATVCPTISGSPSNNIQTGCLYAKANGFTNAGTQSVKMLSSAVGTAPIATQFSVLYSVTAYVQETNPQLFSGLAGNTSGQIQAIATAQVVQLPLPYCIYALNRTVSQSVYVTGSNSSIVSPDCGIADNSSSSTALVVSGNAQVRTGFIKIVGGYQLQGQSTISPTPVTGVGSISDPLASLPAPPNPTKCDFTNYNVSQPPGGTVVLTPGTYCGGINLGGQTNFVFDDGIYYVYGGGITFQTNSATVTNQSYNPGSGDIGGVMFFNTDGHGITGLATSNYAPMTITAQGSITLNAPTSGTYSGVLFYKDRLVSSTSNTDQIQGNTKPNLTGTLYFPGDNLTFTGQSGVGINTSANSPAIIADTFTVNGGGFAIQTGNGSVTQFKFATLVQ